LATALNKFGRVEIVDRPDTCLSAYLRPRRLALVLDSSTAAPRVHGNCAQDGMGA
jgi:hypothetical protein